jgi:hypothetical protein
MVTDLSWRARGLLRLVSLKKVIVVFSKRGGKKKVIVILSDPLISKWENNLKKFSHGWKE